MDKDDDLIKVIVIGHSLVGKTSFIHRYVNNSFRSEYKSTIGVDFALKIVPWSDSKTIKLQLWDIAGQERFTFMTRAYYKDAKGCILMFDVASAESFDKVVKWKEDLDSKVRSSDGSLLPCLLVANKTDLPEHQVTHEQIEAMCRDHNFLGWTETSVKDGIMVKESVTYLLDILLGKVSPSKNLSANGSIRTTSISVREGTKGRKHSSCPC